MSGTLKIDHDEIAALLRINSEAGISITNTAALISSVYGDAGIEVFNNWMFETSEKIKTLIEKHSEIGIPQYATDELIGWEWGRDICEFLQENVE